MTSNFLLLTTAMLTFSFTSIAAENPGGAMIVRVPDGEPSSCIDGKKDAIWLSLRRVITTKKSNWLTKDKSVGLMIETLVSTAPQAPKAISYPLLAEAKIGAFSDGQISIPIEYSIIDSLKLVQDQVRYSGLQIEVTLINKKSNKWGNALVTLQEVTKKLPIPGNPFVQSASYLLDFTNRAIAMEVGAFDKNDKSKGATIALSFDPMGQCQGEQFSRTGTIAVVYADGSQGPGYIPIGTERDYCWVADLIPTFSLRAAAKPNNGQCTRRKDDPAFIPISNNYTAFMLNAQAATRLHVADTDPERASALRRCKANGINEQSCLKTPADGER